MVVVFVLVALLMVGVLVTANWYVWRRLVRDVSRPGGTCGGAWSATRPAPLARCAGSARR